MTRVALFFLSCLMALSILMHAEAVRRLPSIVPHPDIQCRTASKRAACYGYVHNGDTVDCMDVKCVPKRVQTRQIKDGKFPGVGIGIAMDGTHCNINKICLNGICSELAKNERMPREYGGSTEIFECY